MDALKDYNGNHLLYPGVAPPDRACTVCGEPVDDCRCDPCPRCGGFPGEDCTCTTGDEEDQADRENDQRWLDEREEGGDAVQG